jgi:hypothetical protein
MIAIILTVVRTALTASVTVFVYELGAATAAGSSLGEVSAWVTALGKVADDVISLIGMALGAL